MRRTDARCLLIAITAAWWGCRGLPRPAPLPEAHQVPVQQLVFHSDFDLPSDHRLVRELTAERDDISDTLSLPTSDEQIHIYLFRDAEAYGQYLERQFPAVPSRRAFFVETDTRLEVYAHWSDRVAEDLRHEVAHGYLHALVPALPLWLDEGLAEYFEVPRGHDGLNRPHLELLSDLIEHNDWQPDLERLEQLEEAGEMEQADYAEAWGWVYFLFESDGGRRALLREYLMELRDRGRVEPLSVRLASYHVDPERTLAEYLAALNAELAVAKR
jgi:hypothetical protein